MDLVGLYKGKVYVVYVYSPLCPKNQLNLTFVFPCLFGLLAKFFSKNFQLSGHGHFRSHSVQSLGDCLLIATACALTSRLPSLANICQSLLKIFPNFKCCETNSFFLLLKIGVTANFTAKNWRYCQFTALNWRYC